MAKGVLRVRIVGDERELTSSLKRANTEVGKFSGGVSGALKGLALLGGGAALVGGFKKAIDQTVQWGSEVKTLSRNLGVSAEQASALAVGAEHYGIGVDSLSKGLGIFEKHIVAGDKAAQSLGITFKDNRGQLLPFNTILERTSAVFQKLPDGPQKTALALNLFGRSGKELIPFLNAGPKAMREFSDEAKRLGLSLSGDNLRTIANYKFATRDFTASLHGLEVQIGLRVLPVLTTFAHVAATGVEILGKIPTPVLGAAAAFGVFVGAVSLISRFAGAAQDVFGSLGSGLREIFGGAEQATAGLRAESVAATQGIAANTAAATAAGRLTLANDALAGATDQSSLATEIARVQTLKDATAQTIATAASARAAAAAEAQAAANITLGESALAAAIGLQREAVASTEASAAYAGGGLRAALGGIATGLGNIIAKVGPASVALGAVGGYLYFTARAAHAASKEAETFANAFAAAAGSGPEGIQKIKDEIGSLQLELNKAERLTGGRNLLQALTFWKPSDKDRLKAEINDLKQILKDLGIQAEATGDAGATALSKIEDSLKGTASFQENLKKLVAEGVPQQIADQLKSMGQDGQDAAQQLVDGTDADRAAFVALADQTLPYVEPKLRKFFGQTRTEFKAWTDSLAAGFSFIDASINDIANSVSADTLAKAVEAAQQQLNSALEAAQSARAALAEPISIGTSGPTLSQQQQEARLKQNIVDLEARLHEKKKLTLSDLQAERRAKQALSDFEARLHQQKTVSASDLRHEHDLQIALAKANGDVATASEALAKAEYDQAHASELVIAAFTKQLQAQEQYTQNFEKLLRRNLPADLVKQLADMGASGAGLVQALATANSTQFNSIVNKWEESKRHARQLSHDIYDYFNRGPISIPVHIKTPSRSEIADARNEIREKLEGGLPVSAKIDANLSSMSVNSDTVNIFTGGNPAYKSAEGRIVTAPMFSLIGEAGPEAVIPLSYGKKARRDQLLRESGLIHEILASYGVKLGDGALISGRSGGSIPASLYSVASVRAPSPSMRSVTYDDHSTTIINNPVPEKLSETLPALQRRKQLLRVR